MFKSLGRSGTLWLSVGLSFVLVTAGASVVATAAVTAKTPHKKAPSTLLCRPYDRRTVKRSGTSYILRNDVFSTDHECLKVHNRGVGFTVVKSTANAHTGDTDAFPEVVYGCAWGLCSPGSMLPRRVTRFAQLKSSWSTSWRKAPGHFDVAYDIWFGHRGTIHGQALGAELMIWLGTKRFGVPTQNPILRIGGQRYYYARHKACNDFGCWNYILFRRVTPTAHVQHLNLMPFIRKAQHFNQVGKHWWLKSIDAGFEIWNGGRGLGVHNFEVRVKLKKPHHKKSRHHKKKHRRATG